jgi:hypothetical protein
MTRPLAVYALALVLLPRPAAAQTITGPTGALEVTGGYAGFVDDATKHHAVAGGSARWYVSPRVSIGPEVVYMRGPGTDRDLFVTGNVTFDLAGSYGRPPRIVPFVVVGAGLMRHSDRFGSTTFTSSEGAVTGGGGVRGWITDRLFVAGHVRLGWELHARTTASVGWTFGR